MHSSGAFASCERGRMSMHGVIARSESDKAQHTSVVIAREGGRSSIPETS